MFFKTCSKHRTTANLNMDHPVFPLNKHVVHSSRLLVLNGVLFSLRQAFFLDVEFSRNGGNICFFCLISSDPFLRCSQRSPFLKLHHRRPQNVAHITYEILETNPEHGHVIPANMGGKLGDKTGDERKTKPGRRTRHPGQRGRQDRKQEKAKTREADTKSQPRQTHLRQH